MLADLDLIGIPHRVVIGDRGLADGNIEYKGRTEKDSHDVPVGDIYSQLLQKLQN